MHCSTPSEINLVWEYPQVCGGPEIDVICKTFLLNDWTPDRQSFNKSAVTKVATEGEVLLKAIPTCYIRKQVYLVLETVNTNKYIKHVYYLFL